MLSPPCFSLRSGDRGGARLVPHTCRTRSSGNFLSLKRGAAPGGAPASPLGYASPPLPHSCHGFGLRPTRASPATSQPLFFLCAPFRRGFLALASLAPPVNTSFLALPSGAKMPGLRKPTPSFRPQTHPAHPRSSTRSVSPASRYGTAAARLPCGASGSYRRLPACFFPTGIQILKGSQKGTCFILHTHPEGVASRRRGELFRDDRKLPLIRPPVIARIPI